MQDPFEETTSRFNIDCCFVSVLNVMSKHVGTFLVSGVAALET